MSPRFFLVLCFVTAALWVALMTYIFWKLFR